VAYSIVTVSVGLYLLPFLIAYIQRQNNGMTLKSGLEVTQGH